MGMRDIVKAGLFARGPRGCWGVPLIFWGMPGWAKTDIIEGVCHECGLPLEVLSPGERGEAAFGTVPVPIEKDGKTYLSAPLPDWALKFEDAGECGCVFIDETNTAPPALQPALMGGIHARRFGGNFLGARVRVIGAANPVEIGNIGYELAPQVANRLGHVDWVPPTVDEWVAYQLSNTDEKPKPGNAKEIEDFVMKRWGGEVAKIKGMVSGFLRARHRENGGDFLYAMPPANSPQASRGWPSHRSWDLTIRAATSARIFKLDENDTIVFIQAFIGEGAAIEFLTYCKEIDLPNPEDVLDGKYTIDMKDQRLDRTMAIMNSCTALITPQNAAKRNDRADVMWGILKSMLGEHDDLAVLSAHAMSNAGLTARPAAVPVMNRLRPILGMASGK